MKYQHVTKNTLGGLPFISLTFLARRLAPVNKTKNKQVTFVMSNVSKMVSCEIVSSLLYISLEKPRGQYFMIIYVSFCPQTSL